MQILWPAIVLGALGLLFGLVLAFASKKFKVEKDDRVDLVREALPGANCGGCGYAGCDALAEAIVKGEAAINKCPVGCEAAAEKIAKIMGIATSCDLPKVATVRCQGVEGDVKKRYEYQGVKDCQSAADVHGGPLECRFACLGFGNCERACPFGAIAVKNGIAVVDTAKCTGCGVCVAACPRGVIELVPRNAPVVVACRNTDPGKVVRQICQRGCIACKICEKNSPDGGIVVDGNLAKVDYAKIGSDCSKCIEACPAKVLVNRSESR